MAAGGELPDRLLLGRVELQAEVRDPREEPLKTSSLVRVSGPGR